VKNVIRESLDEDPERANTFHNHLVGHARRMGTSLLGVKDEYRSVMEEAAAFWERQGGPEIFASV